VAGVTEYFDPRNKLTPTGSDNLQKSKVWKDGVWASDGLLLTCCRPAGALAGRLAVGSWMRHWRAPAGARGRARRCVRKMRRVCVDSIRHTTSTSTSTIISSRRRLAL